MTISDPKLKAAVEVLEAFAGTGIKPSNITTALVAVNAHLNDDEERMSTLLL